MQKLENISSVYFLGIGGIGMSAIARYFKSQGKRVSGYDKTETALTRQLVVEGISVHYEDDIERADAGAELIVYTPAIPKDHQEFQYFSKPGFNLKKRSEVLGMITRDSFSICVAGTHGKTTTSTMIAHILQDSGFGCNAFLGGIASNYGTNFWSSFNNVSVAEADEYDRSFLQLQPDIAVITSMDADHLDIYSTAENLEDAFIAFAGKLKPGGVLIYKEGLKRAGEFTAENQLGYSLSENAAEITATNIRNKRGSYFFDVNVNDETVDNITLNMGGSHNIENVVAAIAVAKQVGISNDGIRKAVESFTGVQRRFQYVIKSDALVMIDDYAHHPEELRALINSAKELFPGKKCHVIFQPHLFSRTKDFADGFAETLSLADEVWLLPIYPARELPMEGVSSEMLAARMKNAKVMLVEKESMLKRVVDTDFQLLIMCGAGDIDVLVEPVKSILNKKLDNKTGS